MPVVKEECVDYRIDREGAALIMSELFEEEMTAEALALSELTRRTRIFTTIAEMGIVPEEGLPRQAIREFIDALAGLDSNNQVAITSNHPGNKILVKLPVGAGEREGRVASTIVRELHMGLAHGIGRSGSLTEKQPKALGSSILGSLAHSLALDAVRHIGISNVKGALVVPVATGMALSLCLGSWRRSKPEAKYVVYLRVDQRSAFKSIFFPGFEPLIVEGTIKEGTDELVTDLSALQRVLADRAPEILAVLSTTSCFAPRGPDDLCQIGALCKEFGVRHLVNNAYGLQSEECRRRINKAGVENHIDAFVQSLDKNFLVPVGGAVICGFDKRELDNIAAFYPGRASIVPSRDLVITLLELGKNGLSDLYATQARHFLLLRQKMEKFASSVNQKMLAVPSNSISLAMTLKGFAPEAQTFFGSLLFARGITGARVVSTGREQNVEGFIFKNFGTHSSNSTDGYLNVACAIGMSISEIDLLLSRLKETFSSFEDEMKRLEERKMSSEGDYPERRNVS